MWTRGWVGVTTWELWSKGRGARRHGSTDRAARRRRTTVARTERARALHLVRTSVCYFLSS